MGNISAKKYQNVFTYVKVIEKQRWDVFSRHSVHIKLAMLGVRQLIYRIEPIQTEKVITRTKNKKNELVRRNNPVKIRG